MRTTRKTIRSLSLTAVFCMFAALFPLLYGGGMTAYADGDFTFDGTTLIRYNGDSKSVVIPAGTKTIGSNAFKDKPFVTQITLPEGLIAINACAFFGSGITEITLPESVSSLNTAAFDGCPTLEYIYTDSSNRFFTSYNGVLYSKNGSVIIRYPEGKKEGYYSVRNAVTAVGNSAFYGCESIQVVTLPDSVVRIEPYAFDSCVSLYAIDIPVGVNNIGESAFAGCPALRVLHIKAINPDEFAENAFIKTTGITTVNYDGTAVDWKLAKWNNILENNNFTVNCAFEIEDGVFVSYNGVGGTVTIPEGVETIGRGAFKKQASVTSVILPEGVKYILPEAFRGTRITSITLPASLVDFSGQAFDDCDYLEAFYVAGSEGSFKAVDGVIFSADGTRLRRYPPAKNETSYTVSSDVTIISAYAFSCCRKLTSVALPESVKIIDFFAFDESGLTSVTIPANTYEIWPYAFGNCVSLKTVNLTDVSVYLAGAFDDSNSIATVNYEGTREQWESSTWKTTLERTDSEYTVNCAFEITDGVLTRYSGVYSSVHIPEGVTEIGDRAFDGRTNVTSVSIPEGVKKIGAFAFFGTKIASIRLPASLNYINVNAFNRCDALKGYYVSKYNGNFKSVDGVLFNSDCTKLLRFPQAEEKTVYTIPSTVTGLEDNAFSECGKIKQIIMPEGLETIDGATFMNCAGLTEININENVRTVGLAAFLGCEALKTVNIASIAPKDVAANIFKDCDALATVNYYGTESQWGASKWSGAVGSGITVNYCAAGPVITKQPVNISIYEGDSLKLSLKAEGNVLKYQWYYMKKGQTEFSVWNGRTHASETVTPNATWDGIQLYCKVTDSGENYTDSDIVTVTVRSRVLSIVTQPVSKYCVLGNSVTVSLNATGSGLKYQWYYMKKGQTEFSVWNGRTHASETVTPNATWDGIQLYCKVTDKNGESVNSNIITVSVLSITTQPKNQTVAPGQSLTLSLTATGSKLKYQWYYKKDGQTSFKQWSGRTRASETVTPNATWDGIKLYCKVTDGGGNTIQSVTVTIHVTQETLAIAVQPKSQYIVLGKPVTVSLTATGNGLSYQWYYKKSGQTSYSKWNGRTHATETCTPDVTWDGIQLYCIVKDSGGNSVKSYIIGVSVLSISTQPESQTIISGQSLTVSVKPTGTGLKFQWYYKKKGETGFSMWGGRVRASETVTPNDTWNGIQLYCKVTDGAGNYVNSSTATITIKSGITITQQPESQSILLGKTLTLSVSATGGGLKYQWYYKKKDQAEFSVWTDRTHASETVTPNATWDGIQLYCEIKDGAGNTVKSDTVTIRVLSITKQPESQTVTLGNSITISVQATGGGLKYQWYYKKKDQAEFSVWTDRTHASETVTPNATWDGIQLYCIVKDSAGNSVKSDTITVTVK